MLGGEANDLVLRRNDFDEGALVEGIDHHIGLLRFRKGELHQAATLTGSEFGRHIGIGQVNAVVVGGCYLRFVGEPALAVFFQKFLWTDCWQQGEHAVVAHPRARLMGLLQTGDEEGIVGVLPALPVGSRLGSPVVHCKGQGDAGIDVAIGELVLVLGSCDGQHVFGQVALGVQLLNAHRK